MKFFFFFVAATALEHEPKIWHHQSWLRTPVLQFTFSLSSNKSLHLQYDLFLSIRWERWTLFSEDRVGTCLWTYFVNHTVPQSSTCCFLQASLFPVPFISTPPLQDSYPLFWNSVQTLRPPESPLGLTRFGHGPLFFRVKGRHSSEFWSLWNLGLQSHSDIFHMSDLSQVSKSLWVQSYLLILSYLHLVRIRDRT